MHHYIWSIRPSKWWQQSKNSNVLRNINKIYLQSLDKIQGVHEVFDMHSHIVITRRKIYKIPINKAIIKHIEEMDTNDKDVVHPKTSPFSTRHLNWVNYKFFKQIISINISGIFINLRVYDVFRALDFVVVNFILFSTVLEKINLKFFRYGFFCFFQ